MYGKNVLVVGGLGFVGGALAIRLLELKCSVTILDNMSNNSVCSIAGCKVVCGESADISVIFNEQDFAVIFHLGEYSRVEQSFRDENVVFRYNRNCFYEVLNFAKNKRAKLIYSGSSTKFGDGGGNRFASPYALTKYQNTELLLSYAEWHGLDFAIAYFYNVYGPGENGSTSHGTVVQKFVQMVEQGAKTLPVTTPGTQERNFTHIDDTVDALILIAEKGSGDGYGIGSPTKYTILELVELFGCTPNMQPTKKGNRLFGDLVTEKTIALGWSPKMDLKAYINERLKTIRN
jgi:UDP-glucose 4-epimerase